MLISLFRLNSIKSFANCPGFSAGFKVSQRSLTYINPLHAMGESWVTLTTGVFDKDESWSSVDLDCSTSGKILK